MGLTKVHTMKTKNKLNQTQIADQSNISRSMISQILSGKKGLGKAAIGTQYTVVHNAVTATDPGASNNVIGNVIRPNGGNSLDAGQSTVARSYTVRSTNALIVNSDKFAGFGLNAMYVQSNRDANQTTTAATVSGGNTNFTGWGLSADYTWKKLYVTAAYQSFKQETTGTTAGVQVSSFAPPATVTGTSNPNTTDNSMFAGATYDFGILKGYLQYVNQKATNNVNTSQYFSRTAQQVGVRSYITPTIEGWASIGTGRYSAYGANKPTANFNAWQLGSNYYLSKRSNLYAIYGQSLTSSTSTQTMGAAGSQFALGVRHSF
jgi:predicted porin